MGSATQRSFELMDVHVLRASAPGAVKETILAGATMSWLGGTPVAILLSQRLIGAKAFAN
jgi:hypothetical protein